MTTRLPGMEDSRIEELDSAALEYKKYQKKRMAALAKEVEQKEKLMGIMKAQKRKHYKYGDIEIDIISTQEKLKVTIGKEEKDEETEE